MDRNRNIKNSERLFLILHRLLSGEATTSDLLEYLAVYGVVIAPETLYRDIARLRKIGYEIPKATRRHSKYRIHRVPFSLPFSPKEIGALKKSLQRAIQIRAPETMFLADFLKKLSGYISINALPNIPNISHMIEQTKSQTKIQMLEALCQRGLQIQLIYTPLHGKTRNILFEPLELTWQEGYWYLIGYDMGKMRWLELRFERIGEPIKKLPQKCQHHKRRSQSVLFRIYPPLAQAYTPRHGETVQLDPEIDGALLVQGKYQSELRCCQRLLRYEEFVEIISPSYLRERMRERLKKMSERYQDLL